MRRSPVHVMAAAADTAVVWFRYTDLRLRDHEPLVLAHRAHARVVHLFVFDPWWHGATGGGRADAAHAGFPRCGPYRTRFLLEAVADLRASLRSRGSELLVRCGTTATAVAAVARAVSARAVYAHTDACAEEALVEARVRAALGAAVPLQAVWGGQTTHHRDDLGLALTPHAFPAVFTQYRRHVEARVQVRPPLDIPTPLKVCGRRGL
jgi:deoxyribodipyrimidine photo-lyase